MTMKDNIKANKQLDGFDAQWQCRQQWEKQTEKTVPDDKTFLQWVPYAAAASIAIGVTIIGLTRTDQPNDGLPVAEEVTVESQTIHFVCNNGCSAQDIMLLANKVIK